MSTASHLWAEEILVKDGNEYLGHKRSDTSFETCTGSKIVVGPNATIRATQEVCPKEKPGIDPTRVEIEPPQTLAALGG
jgi:hypothetical protein